MKPYVSTASDYAIATTGKFHFYYGYEETDPNTEDWCFVAKKSGKEVMRLTNSQLLELCDVDAQSPESMLLTGILAYVGR